MELARFPQSPSISTCLPAANYTKRLFSFGLAPLLAVLFLLALFGQMNALPALQAGTIRYVTPGGSNTTCSQADPCLLQTAVNQSNPGDEVHAAGGTYLGATPVLTVNKSITISGGYDDANWGAPPNPLVNSSILDGQNNGRIVEISGGSPVLEGFEIRNGSLSGNGAGILVSSGASPLIRNNRIHNNTATGASGGGIYDGGTAIISDNEIYSNDASQGAGIFINAGPSNILYNEIHNNNAAVLSGGILLSNNATAFLEGNEIHNNDGSSAGGGMATFGLSTLTLQNNIFYQNNANQGGGILVSGQANISNNTFAGNIAATTGGGIMLETGAIASISNTIVVSNTGSGITGIRNASTLTVTGDYNNIFGNSSEFNNANDVTVNPQFANFATGNLHILQTSPNVDAGDPGTDPAIDRDIDRQARPNNGLWDIGADEYYDAIPDFSLTPQFTEGFAGRGTTAVYTHTLENLGTIPDSYTFTCSNDLGWTVTCPTDVTNLGIGGLAQVNTQVDVPPTETALNVATTLITATSNVSPTLQEIVVVRTIVAPNPGVSFTPNYTDTLLPGEAVTFTHRITNLGDAPDTFLITIQSDPGGWGEILPSEPLSVPLGVGTSANIQVRVTVPAFAAAGLANDTIVRAESTFETAVFALITDTVTARATVGTRYVAPSGSDTNNNCTQRNTPCRTIAHAIGQASFDDDITIRGGIYQEADMNINDTIHLSGGWNSAFDEQSDPAATVIDAQNNTRIFNIAPGSAIRPSLSNMTLKNGLGGSQGGAVDVGDNAQLAFDKIIFQENQAGQGGAVYIGSGSVVRISQSQFLTNTATTLNGGAVYVNNSTVVLQKNQFFYNEASSGAGGAFYFNNGQLQAENNLFAHSTAVNNGGAMVSSNGAVTLQNNTFAQNSTTTGNGGALYNQTATVDIDNTIFVSNTAVTGGAIFNASATAVDLAYSNIWSNSAPETSGPVNSSNGFALNPQFANAEFRLGLGSPMIDAGNPATLLTEDFENDFRPSDQGYDIGYDELAGCLAKRDDTIYGSIQDAIDAPGAVSDTILVSGICRGVHTITVNGQPISQTVHLTQTLTIQGGWNSDFSLRPYATTIIDPEGQGRGIYVSGNIAPVIEAITIQNGDATDLGGGPANEDAGGGIYNLDATAVFSAVSVLSSTAQLGGGFFNYNGAADFAPIFPQNIITEVVRGQSVANTAVSGAAFYVYSGAVAIDSQEIMSNIAANGGGIFNQNGVLTATNNILAWNAAASGAGIYNTSPLTATLLHQTFYSNTATTNGGGIFSDDGLTVTIRSNIFDQNQAAAGSAIRIGGGPADLDYNYYFDDLSPVSGATVGAYAIVSDATPPGLADPANGDFHLLDDAPAVDGGDPNGPLTRDYENDIRPSDQGPDMGADEVAGCLVRLNENNNLIFGSIQAAMETASPGDILDVSGNCAGTHEYDTGFTAGGECRGDNGIIFTNVHIDKNVTLRGGWNNEFSLRQTPSFLDAEGQGRVIYVAPGLSPTIDGFHILQGNVSGTDNVGAGICVDNASPIITNNEIYSNTASGNGGGIFSINGNPVIDNGNRIRNNSAANGGGVYLMAAGATTATMQNNFIYENQATSGAGIYNNSGDALIWHNTLVNNVAGSTGGAIYIANDSPDIRGNLVVSNTATATGGLHGAPGSSPTADYNNLHANSSNYGGTIGAGPNDLAVGPQFTADFLLSYDSPVVEQGDPNIALDHDYEDDIRPSHQGVDIGADEVGGCYARNTQNPSVVYGSLQLAVDLANDGDTIQVDGLCLGANTRQNNGGVDVTQNLYISKSLTIEGSSFDFDQNSPLIATLDARTLGRVVYVDSGTTVTLTAIILTGGDAASAGIGNQGGGIYNDGTLVLNNLTIRQNNANDGGGVYNVANLTLAGSRLEENTAVNGAALYNDAPGTGFAQITNQNIFTTNVASGNGAAVYQNNGDLFLDGAKIHDNLASGNGTVYLTGGTADPVDVRNTYFYRNAADRGAGVYNDNTDANVWHNTFFNNQAVQEEGGGLYSANSLLDIRSNIFDTNLGTGVHASGTAVLDYNNVIANFPADYGGSLSAGANSISAAPLYVDPATDNFRLLDGSPGADVGDPTLPGLGVITDYNGDIRPTNGGPDMGADEINSCLIQVINPLTGTPNRFGVLQEAIDYAETFATGGNLPDVQIARGECRGVQLKNGTSQVGYVSEDLTFIGSLRRKDFSNPNDLYNIEVGAISSIINAEGDGRVIVIANGTVPTFRHLVFVNGNASNGSGNGNGGGFYNSAGELRLEEVRVCQNTAVDGGGYYGGNSSVADISGTRIGRCVAAHVLEAGDGNVAGVSYERFLGNIATDQGGGLHSANGRFDISNTSFYSNTAVTGGGLYNTGGGNRLINATFYQNTADIDGAGVYNMGSSLGIFHNTYRNNNTQTGDGAAIYNSGGSFTLNSSIIYSNTAAAGGNALHSTNGALTHNLFYANIPGDTDIGYGSNVVQQDPALGITLLTQFSPAIDQADPSLLTSGAPGVVPFPTVIVDFDRQLDLRPDGDDSHLGTPKAADIGSDEYFKDFGCAVEPTPQEQQANPGDVLTYTFDIVNGGYHYPFDPEQPFNGYTDTLTITLASTQGWSTLEGGAGQSVTLAWLEQATRVLTVTVPTSATNGLQDVSTIACQSTAKPWRNGSGEARTNVGLVAGVIVTPEYIDSAQPAGVITYTHQVQNVGNDTGTFQVTPNAGPQHASAVLVDSLGNVLTDTQTVYTLAPLESQTVYLRVTILNTARAGDLATPGVVAFEIAEPTNQGAALNEITILPAPGTRYVAASGAADSTNCTDPAQPCATIQHAIEQAVDGDDVLISTGTYMATVTHTIGANIYTENVLLNKSVTLRGGYNAADGFTSYAPITNAVRLDGQAQHRVIYAQPGITATISSLFIQNGTASYNFNTDEPQYAGGVYNAGANLTISGTWFISNTGQYGAGLYHLTNTLTVNSSVFADNLNEPNPDNANGEGSGIFVESGTAVIENSTFVRNRNDQMGSGISPLAVGQPDGYGGAIFAADGNLTVLNNIFADNTAVLGGAVYISPSVTITNNYNLYWNTLGGGNFLGPNIITGTNSFVSDPLFEDSYFHIASLSPAKDAGTSSGLAILDVDYENDSRPQGIAVDIGADERIQRPGLEFAPTPLTATINSGEIFIYTHTLTNTGDFADNYTLTMGHATSPPGVSGFSYNLNPTSITGLASGSSVTVTFTITGGTPGFTDQTLITATSASALTAVVQDTTTVTQTAGVDIDPSRNGTGLPAQTISYTHTLTNTGDGIDEFTLGILSANPPGWNVTLTPTQTGFLTPGATIPFTVTVEVPAGTLSDTVHVTEIEARATNPDASDILTDTTTVGAAYGLTLTPDNTRTVADSTTQVYTHTLQNTGNLTDSVTLSFSSNPNWPVAVSPLAVTLQPLQTQEVVVTVTVPADTGGVVHTAVITATSQGSLTATAVDTTTVEIRPGVLLEPDNAVTSDAGTTVAYTHTLTNTGNVTDTFDLTSSSDMGWLTGITPGPIPLGPGMTATVTATVAIPGGATPPAADTTVITATSQLSATVTDAATDVTSVRQIFGLTFEPNRVLTVPAGSVISYTHFLTNTGNGPDTFGLTATSSRGWPVQLPPTPIALNSGAGATVIVTQTIPLGASGLTDTLHVTATSTISPTAWGMVTDTTTVSGTLGTLSVTIAPDNLGTGLPGQTIQYSHLVTNTGNITETFSLTAVSDNGWTALVSPPNMLLNPLQSQPVTVSLTIPAGIISGTTDIMTVTARSDTDNGVFDTAVDTTTVGQAAGVLLEPDQAQSTDPDMTISYAHVITNTGNGMDTFTFSAASSHGWPVQIPPNVTLEPGLSANVMVTLTVPPGAASLVDTLTITATSTVDNGVWDTAVDTTSVNGPPPTLGVLLEPDNSSTDDPGVTVQYTHRITNTSTVTETFVVSAVSSQGWTVSVTPQFPRLGPGQFNVVTVRVTIPAAAAGGDVDVTTVTAVSMSDPTVRDTATDTTTVAYGQQFVYLPIILNNVDNTTPTPTPTPTSTGVPPTETPTITPTPCSPTGVDLVVTNIEVQPASPASGQPATVLVTIRNQGTTSVAFGNNFFLDFYVNRTPQLLLPGDITWGIQGVDLAAGTSRTYSASYTFSGGTHQLWAQVDTDNTVDECPNEDNNVMGPISLTVSGASNGQGSGLSVPNTRPRHTPTPPGTLKPAVTPTPY